MWIALSIIGFFTLIFKSKKRKDKRIPKAILIFLFIVFAIGLSKAQEKKVTITGEIVYPARNKGQVYIYLLDESHFLH